MPFFRCGGKTIYQLAKDNILSTVRSLYANNVSCNAEFTIRTVHNAYGWSNSFGISFKYNSFTGLNDLRRLFEMCGYNVSVGSPNVDKNIFLKTGDPNQAGYPGTREGTVRSSVFTAELANVTAYDSNIYKAQREVMKDMVGNKFDISWNFYASDSAGREGQSTTNGFIITHIGNWNDSLSNLFTEAGYNITSVNGDIPATSMFYGGGGEPTVKIMNLNIIQANLNT